MIRPWRLLGFGFALLGVVSSIGLLAHGHYVFAFMSYFTCVGLVIVAVELDRRRLKNREAIVYHLF